MQRRNRSAHAGSNRSVLYSIASVVVWPSRGSAYTVMSSFAVPVSSARQREVIPGRSRLGGVSDP